MSRSNPFSVLAMDNNPDAGPSTRSIEGDEVDALWLKLKKRNDGVDVCVSEKIDLEDLPNECNLMAVANQRGLLVVGSNDDVRIYRLKDIHDLINEAPAGGKTLPEATPLRRIGLPARPVWIRLAMNEEYLIVATAHSSGVFVWKFQDVVMGDTPPLHSFTSDIPNRILDVLPNPATSQTGGLVALVADERVIMADIIKGIFLSSIEGPFTCASWSVRGKQIVLGKPNGQLQQYTPEGVPKTEIPSPPDLDAHPSFVQWLENDLFLVTYVQNRENTDSDPIEQYVIHRRGEDYTFVKFFDPLNGMGYPGRSEEFRHYAGLSAWGTESKHLAFLVSGATSDIAVMNGCPSLKNDTPSWEVLFLDGPDRGTLPSADAKLGRHNTSPIGFGFDFTSKDPVPQSTDGTLPDLLPVPRLLTYSQNGTIISYDVRNPDAGPYPGMIAALVDKSEKPVLDEAKNTRASFPASVTTHAAPKTSAFGSANGPTAFGSASGSTAFGVKSFGSTKPGAFSSPGFADPSKTSIAGSHSAFGQVSMSGQHNVSQPSGFAFGQSSFGSSAVKSATFGGSAFRPKSMDPATSDSSNSLTNTNLTKPAASNTPAFGSFSGKTNVSSGSGSAFGPSSFGSAARPAFGSAFGSVTRPSGSAFGQSSFGFNSKPVQSGDSAFDRNASFSTSTDPPEETLSTGAFEGTASVVGYSAKPAIFASTEGGNKSSPAFTNKSGPAFKGFGASSGANTSSPIADPEKEENSLAFGSSASFGPSQFDFSISGNEETSPASAISPITPSIDKPPLSSLDILTDALLSDEKLAEQTSIHEPSGHSSEDQELIANAKESKIKEEAKNVEKEENQDKSDKQDKEGKERKENKDDKIPDASLDKEEERETEKREEERQKHDEEVKGPSNSAMFNPSTSAKDVDTFKELTFNGSSTPESLGQANAFPKSAFTSGEFSSEPKLATPAFGQSSFGLTNKPVEFGASAFNQRVTSSTSMRSSETPPSVTAFGNTASPFGFTSRTAVTATPERGDGEPQTSANKSETVFKGFGSYSGGGASIFGKKVEEKDKPPVFGSKPIEASAFGSSSAFNTSPFESKLTSPKPMAALSPAASPFANKSLSSADIMATARTGDQKSPISILGDNSSVSSVEQNSFEKDEEEEWTQNEDQEEDYIEDEESYVHDEEEDNLEDEEDFEDSFNGEQQSYQSESHGDDQDAIPDPVQQPVSSHVEYAAADSFQLPARVNIFAGLVDKKGTFPSSQLSEILASIDELHMKLSKQRETDLMAEHKLADLKTKMLKMDLKISQIEKLIRSKTDSAAVDFLQQVDLSAEQVVSQAKLRKNIQETEEKLEVLESLINEVRRRSERVAHYQKSSLSPIERIQRQVRGIDTIIRGRQQTIDELSRRIMFMGVSTPGRDGVDESLLDSSGSFASGISLEPSKDVLIQAEAALAGPSEKIRKRLGKLKIATLNNPTKDFCSTAIKITPGGLGQV
ncbi:uncharacterized protein L203_104048 [Cryptococcus depauperatus CBS 7841]|uniref:Nucleoporin Nup159/Nup146 N-terminal domain-containing protein n=1 Tax=Cryptococcus depauperatus CBS 7841 TaxID=1295531 RepID=A0AAJ8JV22_9TREE